MHERTFEVYSIICWCNIVYLHIFWKMHGFYFCEMNAYVYRSVTVWQWYFCLHLWKDATDGTEDQDTAANQLEEETCMYQYKVICDGGYQHSQGTLHYFMWISWKSGFSLGFSYTSPNVLCNHTLNLEASMFIRKFTWHDIR